MVRYPEQQRGQAFNPVSVNNRIGLYHYQTKSLEEYKARCLRGQAEVLDKEWNDQEACKSDEEISRNYGQAGRMMVHMAIFEGGGTRICQQVLGYLQDVKQSTLYATLKEPRWFRCE